jgi:hypothetical protein
MPEGAILSSKQDTVTAWAVSFFWMLLGNMALFFLSISIAQRDPFNRSRADDAFLVVVVALIVARLVDVACLDGRTVTGEPATRVDWWRYAGRLVAGSLVLWIAAHGLAATGWMR